MHLGLGRKQVGLDPMSGEIGIQLVQSEAPLHIVVNKRQITILS